MREKIINEILPAKYFCVILDTTPDITHINQLAFPVRYILEEMQGGKAVDFHDKLLQPLVKFGLNSKLILGQAMDGRLVYDPLIESNVGESVHKAPCL